MTTSAASIRFSGSQWRRMSEGSGTNVPSVASASTVAQFSTGNGGYGTAAFPVAQIKALALLPAQAIGTTATINQWKGTIALTGNSTNFFADYTNIDPTSCGRLMVKTPAGAGVSGIAVAISASGLSGATVNALPVSPATAASACTGTMALRFVVAG
jgi:hypothetical protein